MAVKGGMKGIATEMADTVYIDDSGAFKLDNSQVQLKWGFDALYSNLAYRLIDIQSQKVVLLSMPQGTKGFLFNDKPLDIPMHFSKVDGDRASLYRLTLTLDNRDYYFDIVRSDLLGELANEAVQPTIVDVATASIVAAFLLFLIVSFIAIRLIVKPANALTRQIEHIRPEELDKRIDVNDVPKELLSIANAMNGALERVEHSFAQQKRFIADAAHELRTPLTIFLNRLELKIPPSTSKEALINDAKYISRIVEQLLDLSRAQNSTNQQLSPVKLADVVKNVCSMLAVMAVDKGQSLELVDDNSNAIVQVDEGELTVIVKNLLENAIKHTPSDAKIKISISGRSFVIEDSGQGIPAAQHEQVFERFWRANQSDRKGSGLGLAITKELLGHYNASITLHDNSTLGGAKFEVEFF